MIFEGTTGDEYGGRIIAGDVTLAVEYGAVLDDYSSGFGIASAVVEKSDISTFGYDIDITLTRAGDGSIAEDIDTMATVDVKGLVSVADEHHGRRGR